MPQREVSFGSIFREVQQNSVNACVPYESLKPGIQKLGRKGYEATTCGGQEASKQNYALDDRE